jgi:hypothetical protein
VPEQGIRAISVRELAARLFLRRASASSWQFEIPKAVGCPQLVTAILESAIFPIGPRSHSCSPYFASLRMLLKSVDSSAHVRQDFIVNWNALLARQSCIADHYQVEPPAMGSPEEGKPNRNRIRSGRLPVRSAADLSLPVGVSITAQGWCCERKAASSRIEGMVPSHCDRSPISQTFADRVLSPSCRSAPRHQTCGCALKPDAARRTAGSGRTSSHRFAETPTIISDMHKHQEQRLQRR